jgi:pyridoxal phosphate enzyme (YggS family)
VSLQNLERLKARLEQLGHPEVRVVAISKTHPAEKITELLRAGHRDFGENRFAEARDKIPAVDTTGLAPEQMPIYHHIGPLQSGNARQISGLFQVVHGASSLSGIQALNKACHGRSESLRYFIQLNLTGEQSKMGGMTIEELDSLGEPPAGPGFEFAGLMTMGPSDSEPKKTREVFRSLRRIRDERFSGMELSMGMSQDYEIALEEGSTLLRIGSLIFGSR